MTSKSSFVGSTSSSAGEKTLQLATSNRYLVTVDRYSVNESSLAGLYYVDVSNDGPHVCPLVSSSLVTSMTVNSSGLLTYTVSLTYTRIRAIQLG